MERHQPDSADARQTGFAVCPVRGIYSNSLSETDWRSNFAVTEAVPIAVPESVIADMLSAWSHMPGGPGGSLALRIKPTFRLAMRKGMNCRHGKPTLKRLLTACV